MRKCLCSQASFSVGNFSNSRSLLCKISTREKTVAVGLRCVPVPGSLTVTQASGSVATVHPRRYGTVHATVCSSGSWSCTAHVKRV